MKSLSIVQRENIYSLLGTRLYLSQVMRETEFIDQNKEKWRKLEELGASKKKDPEILSELFIEATNDLSFSKSYYPNRSIRVYLNNLALKVHSNVYKTRQSTWKRVQKLWLDQIPQAYYEARKTVLLSFIIFFAGVAIGAFSAAQDPGFIGLMFSDGYIEMTMENIENGKPMDVYAGDSQMNMFAAITLNNIRVSFVVFVLGLFFMIGTVGALLQNGALLGAFHFMFYENGYLGESLITVWMHGTPEIGAIILAGAAGMELGRGLIFPGTFTRKESFLIGGKKGVLLIIGVVPVFIFAGFVEGFATRYTDIPDLIRILFILVCAAFMLTYFVIMPRWKFGKSRDIELVEDEVPEADPHDYKLDSIKTHGNIFSDTFAIYSSQFSSYIIPSLGIALAYVVVIFFAMGSEYLPYFSALAAPPLSGFFGAVTRAFVKVDQLYDLMSFPVFFLVNSLAIAGVSFISLRVLNRFFRSSGKYIQSLSTGRLILWSLAISCIAHLSFFLPAPFSFLLILAAAPVLLITLVMPLIPPKDDTSSMDLFKSALSIGYMKILAMVFVLFCCVSLFLVFFNSGLTDYLLQSILSGFKMEPETFEHLFVSINILFTMWGLLMVIPLFLFAGFFSFWSAQEIESADSLKAAVDRIGIRDKAYGILREE